MALTLKKGVDNPRAYCMRCKKKGQLIRKGKIIKTENSNVYYYKGVHKACGGNMAVRVAVSNIDGVKAVKEKSKKKKDSKQVTDTKKKTKKGKTEKESNKKKNKKKKNKKG